MGGLTTGGAFTTVDVYDEALTRTAGTPLSTKRFFPAGATVGSHALFAGGTPKDGSLVVDAYDASLTLTAAADLSSAQNSYAAAAVGGYALFAGDTADADVYRRLPHQNNGQHPQRGKTAECGDGRWGICIFRRRR